ncbi:MAG: transcription elongation factor GreA [Clostridia bacterium]|nr:transcription elongation factor GreA [Clostridia bacterium]
MAEQKIVMTEKNYEKLKQELETLIKVKRPEIIERIKEARSHGDLSENAEYDAAREEQRSNEGKIAELEYKIKNADIREEVSDTSYVHLNSVVTVYDDDMDEEVTYTITSVTEADAMHDKISVESPVGAALLRKRVGDTVKIDCPDGAYTLKIKAIK